MSKSRRDILISAIGASAATLSGTLLVQKGKAQESTTQTLAQKSTNQSSMRILLLNPNSSPDFTKIIAREARRVANPGTEFVEVTSFFGPSYIGTRTTVAIASHAAVDALARTLAKDSNFNAAILTGFGDQGVPAMREFAPFPIVGMLEASVSAALQLGSRFSLLTGGDRWVSMLEEQLYALGLSNRVASVRAIPLTKQRNPGEPIWA